MSTFAWRDAACCHRRFLEVNLPPTAGFVYCSNNNMVPSFQGANLNSIFGYDSYRPSQDVIVVGDEVSSRYILAGAVSAHRSLTFLTAVRRGRLIGIEMFQPDIKPGMEPEKLVVLEGSDYRDLLVEYAGIAAKEMNARKADISENLCGYCSWYYYYAGVTEDNLMENLRALAEKRDRFPARVVQIDDGYQTFQGDWLDQRSAWPTPLAEVAARISDAGFTPGIWTMPLLASTASSVFRDHRDWFVKRADGEPLIFPGWSPPPDHEWVCLDATQPAVKDHLHNIFSTFRKWGFGYFKMDGLGFCMPEGRRFDASATGVSAYREGLMAVREAAPDALLLGCGAPFLPSVGIVDSCRVSQDTAARWDVSAWHREYHRLPPNAEECAASIDISGAYHTSIGNWWMFDRWFRADPDVVIARQDRAGQTAGESRVSCAAGILTGVAITSDNLNTIADDRLALLARAAKLRLRDPRPRLWVSGCWPFAFTGTLGDGRKAACLINDSAEAVTYDLAALGLGDDCEELLHPLGRVGGSITLPPHDAALAATRV